MQDGLPGGTPEVGAEPSGLGRLHGAGRHIGDAEFGVDALGPGALRPRTVAAGMDLNGRRTAEAIPWCQEHITDQPADLLGRADVPLVAPGAHA
jgi:hypothetical protein